MGGNTVEIIMITMTPFSENCYVLKNNGEAIVIDPGEASTELFDALEGCKVTAIVNTHTHMDHASGNAGVKEKTGADLVCHKDAAPMLEQLGQQGGMMGMTIEASPPPDRLVDEGDTISVGDEELKVLYCPGHAPGHIALKGDGFVIVGDVLFAGSIGRTDLPGGSYEVLLDSIKTKLLTLPDDTVVYSGHGPSTTIGTERAINPFLV